MGKNPNAKKLKERKHRERTYSSHDIEDLEEEAARQGITVLELQQLRKEQNGESSGDDSDSSSEQPKQKQVKKKQKSEEEDSDEEVKKVPQ